MARSEDRFRNVRGIVQHICCRNPDHTVTARSQQVVTTNIPLGPIAHIMRDAVYLDYRSCSITIEVRDETADRVLFAEFHPLGPASEVPP